MNTITAITNVIAFLQDNEQYDDNWAEEIEALRSLRDNVTPKRTKTEQIKYFKTLASEYEKEGIRAGKDGNEQLRIESYAKSNAYDMAAFELEHNME